MSYITINTISRFSARCFLRSMMAVVPNVSTMETVVASRVIRNSFPADDSFNPFMATKIRRNVFFPIFVSIIGLTMSPTLTALLIPFLGTALGSAFVFFMKREMPPLVQKVLLGFASGVMVAASVWSLIIPSIEMGSGTSAVIPPAVGLLAGFAFLLFIDYITPHIHPVGGPEGPESRLSRTAKLALAVTIHNFPEGMAVGVAIAGALTADFNMAGALALSLGIAALSGIVEPLGGALVLLLATSILGIMPYMLAFAAGAMLYVVVEELVPEYSQGAHSNIGTIGFALGFILMMVLDVVLG